MSSFKFVHAADLHLDSPLQGLSRKSTELAARIEHASRIAFDNLVALTLEERCQVLLIAGDVFDGHWKDYRSGLFFASRMRTLQEAGVRVFVVLGNHDAENEFMVRLKLSKNVHLFGKRAAESISLDDLGVVIHGQSFPQREVLDNLALSYPAPERDSFNIGLLHTACNGREGHLPYAPCTVEQLANHGYQYWALGHVHAREVLRQEPYVVFPGNLQARHARECGAKGATLVTVDGGDVARMEHRELDVVRWAHEHVDVGGADAWGDVLEHLRERVVEAHAAAEGRALAVRLSLVGETRWHDGLRRKLPQLREELEMAVEGISGDIWLEKIVLHTQAPQHRGRADRTFVGPILAALAECSQVQDAALLAGKLKELKAKLPPAGRLGELAASLESTLPERARSLAMSVVQPPEE